MADFNYRAVVKELWNTVPRLDGETKEEYRLRVRAIAKGLEVEALGKQAAWEAHQDRIAIHHLVERARQAEQEPEHKPRVLTVREELNHPKQNKLKRVKGRYERA